MDKFSLGSHIDLSCSDFYSLPNIVEVTSRSKRSETVIVTTACIIHAVLSQCRGLAVCWPLETTLDNSSMWHPF